MLVGHLEVQPLNEGRGVSMLEGRPGALVCPSLPGGGPLRREHQCPEGSLQRLTPGQLGRAGVSLWSQEWPLLQDLKNQTLE